MNKLICVRRFIAPIDDFVVQWLDKDDPVQYGDWVKFQATTDKRIARTEVDDVVISTAFTGCDMHYGAGAEPCPFETRIFHMVADIEPAPRFTADIHQAREMHMKVVNWVKKQLGYPTETPVGNRGAKWNF